ncbi:glycosyltransferase family 2 protein [Weeksella virosa]|nr:glycosyltransferase family 2 protein [Weeksella virosa]MDK7674775.1 glycosyltransferase family 2 protein [Weeksella virosa]SUP54584.1 Poly-beta-1,6-N-acetyl-D-glucosamine synthase [Weeksella virosa]
MQAITTKLFDKYRVCVIIPTYNNYKTLAKVIDGVLDFTENVLVVNDGSTDDTNKILSKYKKISIIHIQINTGKGNALKCGFRWAKEKNYSFAITIDSDGQHYADDLPVFLERLDQKKGEQILLIGNRNMTQEGIPKKSSFGNNFSNFWFWFETGIKLEDTQSGYRLYPVEKLPKRLYTQKFEFEIEVIVRLAWRRVTIEHVPVKVLYDMNERVSHFRPFWDFARISVLNTFLVVYALFIFWPKKLLLRK